MEKVYVPEDFAATDPINVKEHFQQYQSLCHLPNLSLASPLEARMEFLNTDFDLSLSLSDVQALEQLCTTDKLMLNNENVDLPMKDIPKNHYISLTYPITNEARTLETVKCKEVFNVMKSDLSIDLKTTSLSVREKRDDQRVLIKDIQPGSTFIYTVIIHVPFTTLSGQRLTTDSLRCQYEVEVLGTNTLLQLADVIKCVSDVIIFKEVENTHVDLSSLLNAKEKYPSRCFFIENVFYTDMRCKNSIDYSEGVRKWARDKNIGEFNSESMINKQVDSLKLRLGFGYVYIHQGNCEHIVTFSDARLIQGSDCLESKSYPKVVHLKRHKNYLCFMCQTQHSSWMVMNSDRLPVKRAFFCTKCCESYMFLDGEKLGNFKLYPYYNNEAFANVLQENLAEDNTEEDWMDVTD